MLQIIPFQPNLQSEFYAISAIWIETYFKLEAADLRVLENPQTEIIDKGGYVAFVADENGILGTGALKKLDETTFELIKMGVRPEAQGKGAGRFLANHLIEIAKAKGAQRVVLESNTKLKVALQLYEKLGFIEIPMGETEFCRCDYKAELWLYKDDSAGLGI